MSTPLDAGDPNATLAAALRPMVQAEVQQAIRTSIEEALDRAVSEMRTTLDEKMVAMAGSGGGGGGGLSKEEVLALGPEFCKQPEFQTEIRNQLEVAFQSVLPGLVKRLRGEIEKRIASGEAEGGAGGGGGASIAEVVSSPELKEVLEERFRTMLAYLKQEVIPMAIRQG